MNKKKLGVVIVVLSIATIILGYLASYDSNSSNTDGKIGVAVSIGPEVEWVNAVGGDKVSVTLMVPASSDPHTYEPLPGQLKQVSNDKMYVMIGSPLEFETNYMDKIKSANPNMLLVNASQGVTLIPNSAENESDNMDPHVWTDPKNAEVMVNNIYNALIQVDPNDTVYFQKNRDAYEAQLEQLDNYSSQKLSGGNHTILIYHPAFGYYAKDYNLTLVGAMLNDEEPSAQRIATLVDIGKQNNVKVVYNEPQYDPKTMESVASQIGATVSTVNDLDPNYLANMRNVANSFAQS